MSNTPQAVLNTISHRVESIDVLRGLTIILMVFVNDLAGVSAAPYWLKHANGSADTMTIPDVVFPAFLFVMGMSIPLALRRRIDSGQHWSLITMHILIRTISLLIIGVITLNNPDSALMGWHKGLWKFLVYVAIFAAWHTLPLRSPRGRLISHVIRAVGLIGFIVLVCVFRGRNGEWFHIQWWGILGLIGWSYLIATGIYMLVREHRTSLIGAMALLLCLYSAFREGHFANPWVNGGTIGSHPSIALAGVITGSILNSENLPNLYRVRWALLFSCFMAAAAWLLRPLYGISKIAATPSWCLWSSVITCIVWVGLYWLIDVRGKKQWLIQCRYVGENALFAYLLSSLVYYAVQLTGVDSYYFSLGRFGFAAGLTRAILYTAFIALFSGWIGRYGFRLKL